MPPERKRKESDAQTAFEIYREIIKDNISYDILMQDMKFDGDRLDEIVDIMLETVCTRRKTIRISYSEIVARINAAPLKKSQSHRLNDQIAAKEKELTKITR